MSGADFKAALVEIYGPDEPTKRAAEGLGVHRRTIQMLGARDNVPWVFVKALREERRARAVDGYADILAELRLKALRLSVVARATVTTNPDGSVAVSFPPECA